jgi:uncharacterized protein with HEPN domain
MRLESKKYIYDIAEAAKLVATFIAGKTFSDYQGDAMLRSAVERQLAIAGEALTQLARIDFPTASRFTDYKRIIIAFRNVLVHGYAEIDDSIVWDVLQERLTVLREEAATLLAEP